MSYSVKEMYIDTYKLRRERAASSGFASLPLPCLFTAILLLIIWLCVYYGADKLKGNEERPPFPDLSEIAKGPLAMTWESYSDIPDEIKQNIIRDVIGRLDSAYLDRLKALPQPKIKKKSKERQKMSRNRKRYFKALVARDGEGCLACGAVDDLHIDHINPLIRGGSCELDNLQILCSSCNLAKKTDVIDYRKPRTEEGC